MTVALPEPKQIKNKKPPKRHWYLIVTENATWTFTAVHGPYPTSIDAANDVAGIMEEMVAASGGTIKDYDWNVYTFEIKLLTKKEARAMAHEDAIWPPSRSHGSSVRYYS